MRFAFYPQSCVPFHAHTLDQRPLGGIETGIIRVAEALSQRGHSVVVFTAEKNPPASVPQYAHLSQAATMSEVDVFICVREWIPLLSNIPAKVKLFWTGDAADQVQSFGIGDKRVAKKIDGFLAVSEWQADNIASESGFPRDKFSVIRNGIHVPYFLGEQQKQAKRLIYSSSPYRGLALLPAIFDAVHQKHPDSELHIFSGTAVYRSDAANPYLEQLDRQFAPVFERLAAMPGVHVHGNVPQTVLAQEFLKSSILCYPNTFAETSCISVMEAQAAGCVPLTSKLAALEETVGNEGVLIPEEPGSTSYVENFSKTLIGLLDAPEKIQALGQQGRQRALREHSWQNVAERLEQFLANKFNLL